MYLKNLLWILPFLSFISGFIVFDLLYHQKEFETPALVGKTIEQGLVILSNYNLNARLLAYKEDETIAQGTIISQTPPPSQKIKQNQSVFVVLSTKPKKIKTPHMLGKTFTDIDVILKKHKIHAQTFYIESNYPCGQCFAQKPMPETDLENDTMLIYLNATKPSIVLVPNLKNKPVQLVSEFLKNHNVTYEITHVPSSSFNHTCDNCIISDQRPLSGSLINMSSEKPLSMQLQVTPTN